MPTKELKDIVYYETVEEGTSENRKDGTIRIASWDGRKKSKCFFQTATHNPHYVHSTMESIDTLANKKEDLTENILVILMSIGNYMTDFCISTCINIARLFKKLDVIGDMLAVLPTKEEFQNQKADDAQILGILKLIAMKQGMKKDQIDNLRPPVEYEDISLPEIDLEENNEPRI